MKNMQNEIDDVAPHQHASVVSKFKVAALSAAITSLLCASLGQHASDIEIYKILRIVQEPQLMMMLDTSEVWEQDPILIMKIV
jgi:hypothetical protein